MKPTASPRQLAFRSRLTLAVRHFFHHNGYTEVETPLLSPDIIPEAHIDPIMSENDFLLASPELYMKQLLAQGHQKIFQICKCFRKEEHGERHLSEFTLLEWYGAGQTYDDLMDQCQDLLRFVAAELNLGPQITYQGQTIDLAAPFDRLTVADAFKHYSDTDCDQALKEDRFDEIISFDIEPQLGLNRPLFLKDYPSPLASLAALLPDDPTRAQRFELYAAGMELANGFTELTDPAIQAQRFKEENQIRQAMGKSPLPLPQDFLKALENMPDAAGIALGLDRLIMLFADAANIGDVVSFTPNS